MKRVSWSLYLLTALGLMLAALLIWDGLTLCIMGECSPEAGLLAASRRAITAMLEHPLAAMFGVGPSQLGWYYLVIGLSWVGGLAALWFRQSWGWGVVLTLTVLSLTYPGYAMALAAAVLVLLFHPAQRSLCRAKQDG